MNFNINLIVLFQRAHDKINGIQSESINDGIIINSDKSKNSISCNIHLKCTNQTPWKDLLIPVEIDTSIDKVKYILY